MKTQLLILSAIALFGIEFQLNAQIEINHDRFAQLINQGNCLDVITETQQIRKSNEYGKNWSIDFYMAMGYCCAGKTETANKGFNYIQKEYPINAKINDLILQSKNSCTQRATGDYRYELAKLIISNGQSGSMPTLVSGKLGYVLNCNQDVELYQFNRAFDQSELQNRLFNIDEADKGVNYYNSFLPDGKYNVNASGRFIYVTPENKNLDSKDIQKVTDHLERAYQFMVAYYDVRPPNKLITVYLMGNKQRVAEVALETHGLKIPSKNYGYSCLADLSILGNSSDKGLGTILHELFHLIIRTDIGDIPGWLDEGIACLYEECQWEGDTLRSIHNVWRTHVLTLNNDAKNPLPILRTIIEKNWSEFTPNDATSLCELSVNYAMAKHFAMYLEEKELLPTVVKAYKNRKNVFVDTSYTNENSVAILEKALQKDLTVIQQEFDVWLNNEYGVTTKRETYVIGNRVKEIYRSLTRICDNDSIMADFEKEYDYLRSSLRQNQSDIPEELLNRSIKFISKGEAYIASSEYHE